MNDTQRDALKAAILADPTLAPLASGPTTDYNGLVAACNASTDTDAWKTVVNPQDIDDAPNYTQFDTIPAGKRDSWAFMLAFPRDFTRNKTRKWITDVWGSATAGSNAEAILQAGIEEATWAQVAIGGNVKTTDTVSALDRSFDELVTLQDVLAMFNV